MKGNFIVFLVIFITVFPGCGSRENEKKHSMSNIISASWKIIKSKGITALSADEINAEIEKMYSSVDEVLQKKSTLRQLGDDGENNYRIIFEDSIDRDRAEKDRRYKDPLKK